jgi:DNA polymerase
VTAQPDIAQAIGAALDWWRAAGIDCDFVDDPQDWLAAARPAAKAPVVAKALEPEAPPPPMVGGSREGWPPDLPTFGPWWMQEPTLAPAGLPRLAPRGPAGAALMILVVMPEADDGDRLLSGRGGRMIDAMLSAMGLSAEETYIASALPARVAMPDWAALAAQGLGAVLAHHIALASPRRLLIFGREGISTLLGHDSPQSLSNLRSVDHEQGSVPAISAYDLEAILAKPGFKAQLWNRWLDWTGTE